MGKLIIEGNSVYEIDEDCVRKRKPSPGCGVYEALQNAAKEESKKDKKESKGV